MKRSFKFLLRPTKQSQALAACVEDHRQMYNAALQERRDAYRRSGVTVRYGDQSAQLKDIRRTDPDGQGRWSFSSQQATLRRLDKAMQAFFRRIRGGGKPGYPRFKGAGWFDTVEWPKDRDGCRWDSAPDSGQVRVYLQGVGHVRVHRQRKVEGVVKTITVKREGKRWYVVLIDNPRHGRRAADRLATAQRALARCKHGSNRRHKACQRAAAHHVKVRRQRLDHAHKTALALVRRYDFIAHEDLNIRNISRSAAGTVEQPGTNVAAKSGLNRSILDAGWGVFLNVLRAKAESAGRVVVEVDARNTSRTCPTCGHCAADNRVTQAEFRCVACGYTAHADVNAAQNILRAGLALQTAPAI